MLKAIIFDCFGVLYPQASGAFYEKHAELFKNNPATLDALNLQIDLGKINRQQFFAGIEAVTKIPRAQIQAEIEQNAAVDQKLVELIRSLKKTYKIGLLSNAGKEEIDCIYQDKINGLFDSITVSYEVGCVKPSPEIFLICMKQLGVAPEECLFVDDSTTNIAAAAKLNIGTLHYPTFGTIPSKLIELI